MMLSLLGALVSSQQTPSTNHSLPLDVMPQYSFNGFPILQKVADDIAERYSRATEGRDLPTMFQKEFSTNEELDEYVRSFTYENKAVCFAIAWDEFDPD